MLLLLLGCTPLAGDWSGEADCGDYTMEVEVSLEPDRGGYAGEGSLDCSNAYGTSCSQTFDIEIEMEKTWGAQDLEADLDDCEYRLGSDGGELPCDDPEDIEWDGADTIDGEWVGCTFELERD